MRGTKHPVIAPNGLGQLRQRPQGVCRSQTRGLYPFGPGVFHLHARVEEFVLDSVQHLT
jgi:hypothetical protein